MRQPRREMAVPPGKSTGGDLPRQNEPSVVLSEKIPLEAWPPRPDPSLSSRKEKKGRKLEQEQQECNVENATGKPSQWLSEKPACQPPPSGRAGLWHCRHLQLVPRPHPRSCFLPHPRAFAAKALMESPSFISRYPSIRLASSRIARREHASPPGDPSKAKRMKKNL